MKDLVIVGLMLSVLYFGFFIYISGFSNISKQEILQQVIISVFGATITIGFLMLIYNS